MSASASVPSRPAAARDTAAARTWLRLPWYVVALMVLAVVIRVFFWVYTHRVWEDALITLSPVRNAFTPTGLTHHAGEGRVYSFTSALSVLVPLAGEVIVRGSGLAALRIASILCAPLAVLFTWLICRRLEVGLWPSVLAMTYVAADHEQVFYGMGGMETQLATTILLGSIYALMSGSELWIGASLGLALLARPDFALWVIPAGLYLAWRRGWLRAARVGLVASAFYGPWLVFTFLYYGTIIPQTIQAKAVVFSPIRLVLGAGGLGPGDWAANALHIYGTEIGLFSPFYETGATSSAPLPLAVGLGISMFIVVLAIQGSWRSRRVPGFLPAIIYAGLFIAYLVLFLGAASAFGWYLPPFRALMLILAASGFMRLGRAFPRFAPGFAGVLAALFLVSSLMLMSIDRRVQLVENSVRIELGKYLGEHGAGQTVVTESSGYVGYYSMSKLYDYPGLTSRVSYQALAAAPPQDRSLVYLVDKLSPQWVVFRPPEYDYFSKRYPAVAAHYHVAARFQTDLPLQEWGITIDSIDREFLLLQRA